MHVAQAPKKRVGRPPAVQMPVSRDPDYQSTTIYVHRPLYAEVRAELIRQKRDFSQLVNEVLRGWLKGCKGE